MTRYDVHLYREMRVFYPGIEADTPQQAAEIARQMPTDEAESTEECNGEDLGALVDVVGDEEFEQSVMIDFEPERLRKAATALLEALEEALREIEHWHGNMLEPEERTHPRGSGWARVHDRGRAAIAQAKNART